MKNKYVSRRIMVVVMAAAMTMTAAPAAFATDRADADTIKEENLPSADAEEGTDVAEEATEAAGETKTEYPLTHYNL